jgi:hypothetical protein
VTRDFEFRFAELLDDVRYRAAGKLSKLAERLNVFTR